KSTDYFATAMAAVPALSRAAPGQLSDSLATDLRWVVAFPDAHPECMLGWNAMVGLGADVAADALRRCEQALDPSDPINLQYTSGTTGFPKGALLSHRNLLYNGWYVGAAQSFTAADRICSPVPLYHCFGCVIGVVGAITHGATLLVPAEYFDPVKTLDCMESERATAIYGVPTMFIAELEHPSYSNRDLSSLRTGVMAGAPCPVELMRRVLDDMGASEMTIAYGLTETSPVATQTLPDDAIEKRVETVGIPFPGVEVRVVDPASGEPCVDGVAGEICIRGHNVMLGYYNMPEATAETIDSAGWLHSGDLGMRDPDGYLRITGRIKDMLIRGGENIYPREVEEVLYQHPSVEQAEVIGVPDERLGEEVCAWVKPLAGTAASADELRDFCKTKLAYCKVPRYVIFTDDFPTTVSGKVQKFKLRELASDRLESDESR
ncbi:MAG TPA: AMP-binding protein, partial [Acidobacteriota bacterium]|nr:AMP-binding protein [Acidobacteriota bacterium]